MNLRKQRAINHFLFYHFSYSWFRCYCLGWTKDAFTFFFISLIRVLFLLAKYNKEKNAYSRHVIERKTTVNRCNSLCLDFVLVFGKNTEENCFVVVVVIRFSLYTFWWFICDYFLRYRARTCLFISPLETKSRAFGAIFSIFVDIFGRNDFFFTLFYFFISQSHTAFISRVVLTISFHYMGIYCTKKFISLFLPQMILWVFVYFSI